MNPLAEVSPAAAVRAVVAATEGHGRVRGHLGTMSATWPLRAVVVMVARWTGPIGWTPDLGLVLAGWDGHVAYRFATAEPVEATPLPPRRRAALWLVDTHAS